MKTVTKILISLILVLLFSQAAKSQTILYKEASIDGGIFVVYIENGQCKWHFSDGTESIVTVQDKIIKGYISNTIVFETGTINDLYIEVTFYIFPYNKQKCMAGSILYGMARATLEYYANNGNRK